MTTTEDRGDKPATPVRRRKTATATASDSAEAAKASAPQKGVAKIPRPKTTPQGPIEPREAYRSSKRVWPD